MQHAAARQQFKLLGAVKAVVTKGADVINPALVVIDRDVQVPADNGLSIEKRTIVSLLGAEVGKIAKSHTITLPGETLSVQSVIADDGFVVEVFVRG